MSKAIRAKRAFPYSLDGINVKTAEVDEVITLRAGAADALVLEGYAEHEPSAASVLSQGAGGESVDGSGADADGTGGEADGDSMDGAGGHAAAPQVRPRRRQDGPRNQE